jgi:hypothetical protein
LNSRRLFAVEHCSALHHQVFKHKPASPGASLQTSPLSSAAAEARRKAESYPRGRVVRFTAFYLMEDKLYTMTSIESISTPG